MTQVPSIPTLPKGATTQHVKILDTKVAHGGGTTQVLYTAPAGHVVIVDQVIAVTEVAWDGTGADCDIGMSGDHDGFIDGSAVTITAEGAYGVENDAQRGAYMYNSTDKRPLRKFLQPTEVINAYVTPGTGHTAGRTRVIMYGFLIKL